MYSEELREKRELVWPEEGGVFGEVNVSLTREVAVCIGQVVALMCKEERVRKGLIGPARIVQGKTPSKTSYPLQAAFEAGGTELGAVIYQPGPIPLPGLVKLIEVQNADRGVMVNGQDGPSFWSGFQIFTADGAPISKAEWQQIRRFVTGEDRNGLVLPHANETGRAVNIDQKIERYIGFLRSQVEGNFRGLHVVLDCANGTTFKIAPGLLEELRVNLASVLSAEPDGLNINQVEVNPEHGVVDPVGHAVRHYRADIGIALSADGTSVRMYDERGRILDSAIILAILHEAQQEAHSGRVKQMQEMLASRSEGPAVAEPSAETSAEIALVEAIQTQNPKFVTYERGGRFKFFNIQMVPDGLLAALHMMAMLARKNSEDIGQYPLPNSLSEMFDKKAEEMRRVREEKLQDQA